MLIRDGHLYCADALDVMRDMPDESVDLICTDPSYKVISGGQGADRDNGYHASAISGIATGKIFKHQSITPDEWMPEFYRVLRSGSHCYVMTNRINLRLMLNLADAVGFHLHNLLRWDKPNVNTNRWYMIDCEFTVFLAKKPVKAIRNCGSKQGYPARMMPDERKYHPTQKPIALMDHYIMNSSEPGQVVFDPFAGAGSTLIAAQRAGRRWIGCEIDPVWYNVAAVRVMGT